MRFIFFLVKQSAAPGIFSLALLGAVLANSATAKQPIEVLSGEWIQGGLIEAKVAPGATVKVFDREAFVDDQGRFIVGLGRDAPETLTLVLTDPNLGVSELHFQVAQREYAIQRIDGVADKYVSPPEEVLQRIRQEASLVKHARAKTRPQRDFASGFIRPAQGRVTGVYGSQRVFNGVPKRPHFGLDIAGPVGAKVIAPAAGKVSLVHRDMYYSGGTLIIDHGQGLSSTFIHLSQIDVKEGQFVERGQKIAEIGATGRVTGPHLDWRMNWFEQRIDPQLLLLQE